MTISGAGHAALSAKPKQPSEMEASQGNKRLLEETDTEPKVCPTDGDTIVAKPHIPMKHLDKQSMDYVIRSGIAGGLAGCAVGKFR